MCTQLAIIVPYIRPQESGPVLVKECSDTAGTGSTHPVRFSPSPSRIVSQSSRGSNASTLHCSLVALELDNETERYTVEADDSVFYSPYVPVTSENVTTKEQLAVSQDFQLLFYSQFSVQHELGYMHA